jgi:hypothetical protein
MSNKELTSKQINIVIEAQHQMIDFPKKAVVNSESFFVKEIIKQQDYDLAMDYWSWVCALPNSKWSELFNDPTIQANQKLLKAIDASVKMPSWGYANT